MCYSLFVFRFYYKIIGLPFFNLAGRGLTRLWDLKHAAGPGLGLGLNSSLRAGLDECLRAWAGPVL